CARLRRAGLVRGLRAGRRAAPGAGSPERRVRQGNQQSVDARADDRFGPGAGDHDTGRPRRADARGPRKVGAAHRRSEDQGGMSAGDKADLVAELAKLGARDPESARLMGMIVALAGEVFVLKAQLERLTRALEA